MGAIGPRWVGGGHGQLHVLLPSPVDSDACLADAGFGEFADSDEVWDRGFDALVRDVVDSLRKHAKGVSVVAPRGKLDLTWSGRLVRFLRFQNEPDPVNPDGLEAVDALLHAARDDSYLQFAAVDFLDASHPVVARVFISDGHPLIWIWLADDWAYLWAELARASAGALPMESISLAWERLVPRQFTEELPRARIHRGDSASWTDGMNVLGFHAGLGVTPAEVYLPPEREWATVAPIWAREKRSAIVRDFIAIGVRVVDTPGAAVWESDQSMK